jgi:hypothetical protein
MLLGQSSHNGIRLTGAWGDDAPCAPDVPDDPPVTGDGTGAAPDIVLVLPGEAVPGTADRGPGVVKPGDIDPTAPVFVVGPNSLSRAETARRRRSGASETPRSGCLLGIRAVELPAHVAGLQTVRSREGPA